MNTKNTLFICAALSVLCLLFSGCGKKTAPSEGTQSLSDLKAAAEKMSVQELRDMAMKYKNLITAGLADMDKLEKSGISLTGADMVKKGEEIKAQIDKIEKQVEDYKARLQIYIDQLKAKGEAITGLEL
jgi:uncharacterized radical SAM superfamily protein